MRARALKLYRPPFRYEHGYIFDSQNEMVVDDASKSQEAAALRVRGWGRISYLKDPEELQDAVGALIAEALTTFWRTELEKKE